MRVSIILSMFAVGLNGLVPASCSAFPDGFALVVLNLVQEVLLFVV